MADWNAKIHILPANAGDCFLIEFNNNECILIYTGFKETYYNYLKPLLIEYFSNEKVKENFSNARCVRNLFEKIKFEQADRVARNSKEELNLIKKCDVENVLNKISKPEKKKIRIGFAN